MSAVGKRDDFAARIVHRLSCTRCVQGWSCGGLAEGDYAAAADIADLLAEVRADERSRVAQAIEQAAVELCEGCDSCDGNTRFGMRAASSVALMAVRDA